MPTAYDVPAQELIHLVAEELKKSKKITPPEWASYVKTGSFKQHAPQQADWWFVRCASLLRKVYVSGPIGTSHLRKEYGGLKRGRSTPERFQKASGAIIRKALQQLEAEGLVSSERRGRTISPKGRSILDKAATSLIKDKYPELKKY
ncbi:MAG TPA: 30S ribosomal protein S19e [candidate division Zixibacteria bacterium]|nr:30S ribosomal protein S19e [candidate division Zixibacteria bacterium]